jgi:mono/diheme cytochrome c family protein
MMSKRFLWLSVSGSFLLFLALILGVIYPAQARASSTGRTTENVGQEHSTLPQMPDYMSASLGMLAYHTSSQQDLQRTCAIHAVDLIGAWVDAGAMESQFPFTSMDDEACIGDFEVDVLPLFTTDDAWFEGSISCTSCHFDNSEDSRHEMDLSSFDGLMTGGDVLSKPPGEPIITPGDWEESKLRARLRNNRMPPGWEFDIEEGNRDGPLLELDGGEIYAVDLIGAWVDAGTGDSTFAWINADGEEQEADFTANVLPLFTEDDIWFDGSAACASCHFDNSEDSRHEMDLSSYDGIMTGGDVLSKPPGEAIVESGDWEASKLRARLRNNRMPPGWEFDIEEANRDGPVVMAGKLTGDMSMDPQQDGCGVYAVDLIGAWVDSGAEEGSFAFDAADGTSCLGEFETDVLPLFTMDGAWFEGSDSCTSCHFDNSEDSRHEMDLSSFTGLMTGGDVLSKPPGEPIIAPGDWEHSKLRARLRDNRMPPGWEFDIEEGNRDGPLLELDGGEIYAVDLIGAWVDAGTEDGAFTWVNLDDEEQEAGFDSDVLPLFTEDDIWFEGSDACTSCHFDNSEDSRHEMDLSSYEGIMTGGDVLSKPPGEPIVESGDWEASKLRSRLRNNRMPPGWEFDIEEGNRDGPMVFAGVAAGEATEKPESPDAGPAVAVLEGDCDIYAVDLIEAWVDGGAELGSFSFISADGSECVGEFESDVLPLFTTDDSWFAGSEACTNCHFDNSEDSRHEMDLSSYQGIMTGGDVLSKPPGVAIVVPGHWDESNLRARLRNNRMPPGWEFDIEESNRDGPLLNLDGGEIYAVDLIGAWVDSGAVPGAFTWIDMDGQDQDGDFAADVLPLFTEDDAWFDGSEACTNCHFDNSEDSRHEMDLSSHDGIMTGGDVLSKPPGVAIVEPGDWDASKLRARLRNNRMPPGWLFDIEETNRDGPMVYAGVLASITVVEEPEPEISPPVEPPVPSPPPELPEPTITETSETAVSESKSTRMFLALFALILLVFAIIIGFAFGGKVFKPDPDADGVTKVTNIGVFLFAISTILLAGLALYAVSTDAFTETVTIDTTIREEVPYAVEVAPVIPIIAEVRLEEWQARIPKQYANQNNPFSEDPGAVQAGRDVFLANECSNCHGEDLQGSGPLSEGLRPKPVNLTDPTLMSLPFVTDDYLYWRISDGGAQAPFLSAMPAWRYIIPEEERWQLVSFIRSQVNDEAIDEGEQAAVAVIEKGGCFACHRVDVLGRGGRIGPAWEESSMSAGERISGVPAETYLRDSILDPASFIVPGFEEASAMPANFNEILTPEEIDILVDFVLQLSEESGE